jgi:putative phage-type endonuclease
MKKKEETKQNVVPNEWITPVKDRTPEWHEYRKTGIGASSAAIVLGINPYNPTAMQLYHQKVGTEDVNFEMSEAAYQGIKAEDAIANDWQYYDGVEGGYVMNSIEGRIQRKMYEVVGCIRNPKYEHLFCNLDRVIKAGQPKLNMDGTFSDELIEKDCPLEIKTMNGFVFNKYGGVPDYYIVQVHQQMLITETDYSEIVVRIDGNKIRVFPIHRNEEIINQILESSYDFWKRVLQGRQALLEAEMAKEDEDYDKYDDWIGVIQQLEPEPNDNENYSTYLSERHEVEQEIMMGDEELLSQAKHLQTVKEMIKQLEKEKRELENKVKHNFVQESVEKIEFPGNGYMRYYQRANNKTKMLDVRITKPDSFMIGVELEGIDKEIGYII